MGTFRRSCYEGCYEGCPSGAASKQGGRKITPNRGHLPSWTSKHGELAIGEREDNRSLEEENGQPEHLVAGLSLERKGLRSVIGRKNGWISYLSQ
jgi:hypothetical protein